MKPSTEIVIPKKKRGPKPTGQGQPIVVRVHPDLMADLDAFIARQPVEPQPSRPDVIRDALRAFLTKPPAP